MNRMEKKFMCVAILLSVLHLKSPTGIFKVKFNVILGYDGQKGGIITERNKRGRNKTLYKSNKIS